MVTIKILCAILEFAVLSLVQIFKNGDSGRLGVFEMCLDVFDEHGQARHVVQVDSRRQSH